MNNNKLLLVINGSPGSNWQYQCYKEIDSNTSNSLTDLLRCENEMLSLEYQGAISKLIDTFKNGNKKEIANLILYPLFREYPLTPIDNEIDFLKHYDEIFDDLLIQVITKSNPSLNWVQVGMKGIMLNNGTIWLEFDGKICGINYITEIGEKYKQDLISEDIKNLHPSLIPIKELIHTIETKDYKVRIDLLPNDELRFSIWDFHKSMKDNPKLVIKGGEHLPQGSGGNSIYQFKNGDLMYLCSINRISDNVKYDAELVVFKNNILLYSQEGNYK